MSAPLAALRGIRRAISMAWRVLTGRLTPAAGGMPTDPPASSTDVMLQQVHTLQLEAFGRSFSRYNRPELAEIGAEVASIPGAAAAVAAQFTDWATARAARAQLASDALEQRATAAATVGNLAARQLPLVPLILHRASLRVLRPVTPRAPAPARLT